MKKIPWIILLTFTINVYVVSTAFAVKDEQIRSIDLNLEDQEAAMTFLNLSNGEATLIQTNTENVLVNTGDKSSRQELKALLDIYKVDHIDEILITHSGELYLGNLNWLIQDYDVGQVLTSTMLTSQLSACADQDETHPFCLPISVGQDTVLLHDLSMNVLSEAANGSLNVLMNFGENHIIYMGYDDEEVEEKLAKSSLPQATILKVSNFGEEPAINDTFLEKIDPLVAIIFHRNDHLPSETVLKKLQIEWLDLYRTFQSGCITMKMNTDSYELFTFKPETHQSKGFTDLLHFVYKMITMDITV